MVYIILMFIFFFYNSFLKVGCFINLLMDLGQLDNFVIFFGFKVFIFDIIREQQEVKEKVYNKQIVFKYTT